MTRVFYAKKFLKQVKSLPQTQQSKLKHLIELLYEDRHDSQLHSKPLRGELKNLFSFRVTRDWRVLFRLIDDNSVELMEVEHRKDIYR